MECDGATIKNLRRTCRQVHVEADLTCLQNNNRFIYMLDWHRNPCTGEDGSGCPDALPEYCPVGFDAEDSLDITKLVHVRHLFLRENHCCKRGDGRLRVLSLIKSLFPNLQSLTWLRYRLGRNDCYYIMQDSLPKWFSGHYLLWGMNLRNQIGSESKTIAGWYSHSYNRALGGNGFDCLPLPRKSKLHQLIADFLFHAKVLEGNHCHRYHHDMAQLLRKTITRSLASAKTHQAVWDELAEHYAHLSRALARVGDLHGHTKFSIFELGAQSGKRFYPSPTTILEKIGDGISFKIGQGTPSLYADDGTGKWKITDLTGRPVLAHVNNKL